MKNLSKGELLIELTGAFDFYWKYLKHIQCGSNRMLIMKQVRKQIRQLIESSAQKPSEAELEELVNKWAEIMCNFRTAPKVFKDYKLSVKMMFKEYRELLRRG